MTVRIRTLAMVWFLAGSFGALSAWAVPVVSNDAPISEGLNVLAGAAFNDAPGSSDLTLIVQLKADDEILVDEGSPCKVIQPLENIPSDDDPTGWTQPTFDDSGWLDGSYGIGYGDGDDNTVIGDGQHAAVYSRASFEISNISSIKTLILGVDYDDGFVVWINGVEVARESGTDISAPPPNGIPGPTREVDIPTKRVKPTLQTIPQWNFRSKSSRVPLL